MKETDRKVSEDMEMKELDLNDLEQVNGGVGSTLGFIYGSLFSLNSNKNPTGNDDPSNPGAKQDWGNQ